MFLSQGTLTPQVPTRQFLSSGSGPYQWELGYTAGGEQLLPQAGFICDPTVTPHYWHYCWALHLLLGVAALFSCEENLRWTAHRILTFKALQSKHLEIIPTPRPQSCGKLSSMRASPGAKDGAHCSSADYSHSVLQAEPIKVTGPVLWPKPPTVSAAVKNPCGLWKYVISRRIKGRSRNSCNYIFQPDQSHACMI